MIRGSRATSAAFADGLESYDVVHFAGHAITDPRQPWLSRLVMGPDPTHDALRLSDLRSRRAMSRVVVLAACSTAAAGPLLRGETLVGLAWPILARGVPVVVASLWDVDDAATAELLTRFHRALLAERDAARAMWRAQQAMRAHPDPGMRQPSRWASFVVIGGATTRAKGGRP